ncbi:DUF2591 domain-containing protein [Pantoea sp. ACRSH]|uniref:phage protein NinX family protein n=1 Tax=unclassified Pantoea TaxID=2630326 RepID=UPI001EF40688|nr:MULTISPECIES: phage protein NinX family protein [unclassified Pantoea]MCG7368023.1 DUF2591 domain-containing protein [Pantoea sp. ACRSH]MCG7398382.1 DUF2591 domain-containing protein [Pantoea sp. ACRSC]
MNYSEMKDHEINAAVGEAMGWNAKFIHQDDSVTFRDDLGRLRGRKNYCNSWADAGPIIEKENISLTCHQSRDEWAAIFNRHAMAAHRNPLRAAMECYLIKKERDNA